MTTAVAPAETTLAPDLPKTEAPVPLRAVHTPNFPALLRQLGASLLVTTYQAGKLVMVRDEGDHLNTHFRGFQAPMGMALSGDRLAVGTKIQVWEFVDVPAVTARLEPPGRHDACFLPRSSHVTGNIQIHEMAWGAGNELWVVNTRFSCLCTLDGSASFAPRLAAARASVTARRPSPAANRLIDAGRLMRAIDAPGGPPLGLWTTGARRRDRSSRLGWRRQSPRPGAQRHRVQRHRDHRAADEDDAASADRPEWPVSASAVRTAVQEVFAVTVLPGRRGADQRTSCWRTRSWCPTRRGRCITGAAAGIREWSCANGAGIVSGHVTGKWRAGGVSPLSVVGGRQHGPRPRERGASGTGGSRPPLAANLLSAFANAG